MEKYFVKSVGTLDLIGGVGTDSSCNVHDSQLSAKICTTLFYIDSYSMVILKREFKSLGKCTGVNIYYPLNISIYVQGLRRETTC